MGREPPGKPNSRTRIRYASRGELRSPHGATAKCRGFTGTRPRISLPRLGKNHWLRACAVTELGVWTV